MESGGQETPQIPPTTRQLTKHVRKLRRAECICENNLRTVHQRTVKGHNPASGALAWCIQLVVTGATRFFNIVPERSSQHCTAQGYAAPAVTMCVRVLSKAWKMHRVR